MSIAKNSVAIALAPPTKTLMHLRQQASYLHGEKTYTSWFTMKEIRDMKGMVLCRSLNTV